MYRNFRNLTQEKQKKILAACIHEFAARGYEQASTNTMIKEAGISKGILFHYFQNKRNLFLYIVDHCFQEVLEEYNKYPLKETGDIFQRLIEFGVLKLKLYHAYPEISKILLEALVNTPEELRLEIETKYSQLSKEFLPAFFQEVDDSKFRKGVDTTKAIQILTLFLEALGQIYLKDYQGKEQEMLQDVDKIMAEYNEYMEILKYGMYSS